MLKQEEKQQLFEVLNKKKEVVKTLRSKLNEINDQKEKFYSEKNKHSTDIRNIIRNVKDAKSSRDKLSGSVKDEKKTRDELNQKIKDKIEVLKKMEKDKQDILTKHNIQGDPGRLKKEIERIEYNMETSVMSFDKERTMMKQIKLMKTKYKESEKVSGVWKKINELAKEIEQLKQEANLFHKKIQVQAKQSQEKHEVMIDSSKMIKDLKKKEKDANTNFLELKKQFTEMNDKLKGELKETNDLYGKLDINKEEMKKDRNNKQKQTIEDKKKEVDEKLKKGGKLTNEDLLAFQSDVGRR